jgi:hypothetical protein
LRGIELLKEWKDEGKLAELLQMQLSTLIEEVEEKIKSFKESQGWKTLREQGNREKNSRTKQKEID